MHQYYIVIGVFLVVCLAAVFYVLMNPKKNSSQIPVIDDAQIMVHNGQQSSNF